MSFGSDLANYAKKTKVSIDNAVISINTQVATSIIKMTPFDTGRARGNWLASIDKIESGTSETAKEANAMYDAISTASKSAGTVFYLTNNLPYIQRLEYDNWSKQAPQGMVRISIASAKSALRKFSATR